MGSQGEFGFYHDNWQYESLTHLIPEGHREFTEVWDVYLINSKVFFCTFQGIFSYDGQKIEVIKPKQEFERSFLINEQIFTQDQSGQLYEVVGNQLNSSYQQTLQKEIIAGLIAQNNGLLIIYNSGLIEFSTPYDASPEHKKLSAALRGTFVNHVTQLSDNRLAIATQRAGLFLYDLQTEQIEHLSTQNGLESNACLRTFQDYAGNLWVGMQNGIALVHVNAPFRLLSQEINLQGSGYDALETAEGTYFTTSNGIFFLARDADKCLFLEGTEGPAYRIQEIAGKIYAGHHTGLFLLKGARAIRKANTDGLWQVKQLRSKPGFAVGGTYSGLFLFKINAQGELEPMQAITGFNASSRFMEEDNQGNLWVGQYYLGLYRLSFSAGLTTVEVQNISDQSELPIKEQIILSRINDELYLATRMGIYRIATESGALEKAQEFAEIGQQPVYLLAQDEKNRIHIITEDFIAYYNPISDHNHQFVRSSLYQLRYHLNNDLLHLSAGTGSGVLFSANDGFIHYDPLVENIRSDYLMVIRQIADLKQGQSIYLRSPFAPAEQSLPRLSIKARARLLKIDVDFFQFNGLENQQFRYQLQGLEEDYGDWTNSAIKEYTNLEEGDYTLKVQTRNQVGQITEGLSYKFTIQAPFYKSITAQIIYLLLGLTSIFLLTRVQKQRYKRKTAKKEKEQQKILAQKQEKLRSIKQKKDQELLKLKEAKIKSELQHINNLLAASTMNLVVKNEFIESIKNDLKAIKQKSERKETRREIEKIVKEIETNLRVQEDWEQFQYHFDAVHGDFLSRLREDFPDISPNEQKLCAFLRMNLQTKDIANILGISVRGVEVARYRLRKRLNLKKGQNLSKFILEY